MLSPTLALSVRHLVFTTALGGVELLVGALEELLDGGSRVGDKANADRDGQLGVELLPRVLRNREPQALTDRDTRLNGGVGHDHEELLSPIAHTHIAGAAVAL